jgi:predicted DNA-binding transcriptional regulator YafY
MTKTERWLNLLAFLLEHRRPVPREEILSQVSDYKEDWVDGSAKTRETVRRKFERDKKELKQLGVVLEPLPEKALASHSDQEVEVYQLRPRDFYLPYLKMPGRTRSQFGLFAHEIPLTPAELPVLRRAAERVAALSDTPLGTAARSAVRKLAFDLPELAVGDEERGFTAPAEIAEQFAALRNAVESRRAVRCRYYTIGRDTENERIIEPYGLMLSWGHWYCVGRARDRNALRVFRLDRMKNVQPVDGESGEFRVPKDFRIQSYLNRAPWELSEEKPVDVRVRIDFPQSRWVIGERIGKVITAVTDNAGSEFEFAVRNPDPFIRWLLPLGEHAQIVSPPSMKKRLQEARALLRAVYK